MNDKQQYFAVLFSDIAGSTQIYEKLGDAKASHVINSILNMLIETVELHGGTLIKTIGDEIMCRFTHADAALESACQFNTKLDSTQAPESIKLAVRTGIHWGPALLQADGDLLGDGVNVAARMTSIAKARQIIITQETYTNISTPLKSKCREFDRSEVKGKSELMVIFEVIWEPKDITRMAPIINTDAHVAPAELDVFYQNNHKTLSAQSGPMTLGRGEHCDFIVKSQLASRNHAIIKYNRGKYILIDQSTNGTYVQFENGKTFYLRRENLPLSENGKINLGENFESNRSHEISFQFTV